jgi:hypothetical protein
VNAAAVAPHCFPVQLFIILVALELLLLCLRALYFCMAAEKVGALLRMVLIVIKVGAEKKLLLRFGNSPSVAATDNDQKASALQGDCHCFCWVRCVQACGGCATQCDTVQPQNTTQRHCSPATRMQDMRHFFLMLAFLLVCFGLTFSVLMSPGTSGEKLNLVSMVGSASSGSVAGSEVQVFGSLEVSRAEEQGTWLAHTFLQIRTRDHSTA